MTNSEIAKILREIGEYLEMQGELVFKVRAYEKASEIIESLSESLKDIYAKDGMKGLEEISGIGRGIAEKIEELLKTGKLKYYEKLKKKAPVNLEELSAVEGLGPKKILKLYQELDITNLTELKEAAEKGKIAKIESFGEKTEEKILKGIEFLKKSGGRLVLGFAMPEIKEIESRLAHLKEVERVVMAGSVRRGKETIGDIDILVTLKKGEKSSDKIMDFFTEMSEVDHVVAKGETKSVIKLKNGLEVDLRVVPQKSFGAALNYFTGSKDHNVALRQIAIEKGYKLNEYGLFSAKGRSPSFVAELLRKTGASGGKGWKRVAGETEEELYEALGLKYIEPELREMRGEIEAAFANKLPRLIGYGELKGDLQTQTNWTDGANSIEEMAKAAIEIGLEYIVITDHTKSLAMTGGLDSKKIIAQGKEIDKLNQKFEIPSLDEPRRGGRNPKFRILKGTECDILKDGSLDLPDSVLRELDVVGASVHSHFKLSREEQTKRIIKAMKNSHVDILFHPTGRILNKRPAYDVDMNDLIKTAKETGIIMEIDAYPDRLDLKDEHIRQCVEAGVKMSIDSDAHAASHFKFLKYGIAQARRGWATKEDIINAWPLEKMLSFLKKS